MVYSVTVRHLNGKVCTYRVNKGNLLNLMPMIVQPEENLFRYHDISVITDKIRAKINQITTVGYYSRSKEGKERLIGKTEPLMDQLHNCRLIIARRIPSHHPVTQARLQLWSGLYELEKSSTRMSIKEYNALACAIEKSGSLDFSLYKKEFFKVRTQQYENIDNWVSYSCAYGPNPETHPEIIEMKRKIKGTLEEETYIESEEMRMYMMWPEDEWDEYLDETGRFIPKEMHLRKCLRL